MNHKDHQELFYYPSKRFIVGSQKETAFFKSRKWTIHPNRPIVKRIYSDILLQKNIKITCPCQFIFMFTFLNKDENKYWIQEERTNEYYMTNKRFFNTYEMKTKFFDTTERTFIDSIQYKNVLLKTFSSEHLNIGKEIEESFQRGDLNFNVTKFKSVNNNRNKCDFRQLKKDIVILKNFLYEKKSETCAKKLLKSYIKLEYYSKNNVLLKDINDYKKRVNCRHLRQLMERFTTLIMEHYMLEKYHLFTENKEDCSENAFTIWEYDRMLNKNYKYGCKHDEGFNISFIQTRSGDEVVSTVRECKKCKKVLL